jgi:hypothetical protein
MHTNLGIKHLMSEYQRFGGEGIWNQSSKSSPNLIGWRVLPIRKPSGILVGNSISFFVWSWSSVQASVAGSIVSTCLLYPLAASMKGEADICGPIYAISHGN